MASFYPPGDAVGLGLRDERFRAIKGHLPALFLSSLYLSSLFCGKLEFFPQVVIFFSYF